MARYLSPVHLPRIDDMTATPNPGLDREQWSTRHIGSLTRGHVFALPGETVRPLVLTETRTDTSPHDAYGTVIGEARDVATGSAEEFKLRANAPVLTRCDLRYEDEEFGDEADHAGCFEPHVTADGYVDCDCRPL